MTTNCSESPALGNSVRVMIMSSPMSHHKGVKSIKRIRCKVEFELATDGIQFYVFATYHSERLRNLEELKASFLDRVPEGDRDHDGDW